MAQPQAPTLINLPPSGSDSPDPPGTPTSTTTSLSALSTTAIKDGHRGHSHVDPLRRAHAHHPSTTSLEAERADRISRLAGLERITALRTGPNHASGPASTSASLSPQATPNSSQGFPLDYGPGRGVTPAYFDARGQPVAAPTKLSTTGTVSATSAGGSRDDDDTVDTRTTTDRDDDMMSVTDTTSMGPMMPGDPMDDDMEGMGARSVAGFDDRFSDDGSASLVGFGEGAGSTVSGPISQRRPVPQSVSQGSGLSEGALAALRRDRDRDPFAGSETPVSASALQERREARMVDGVAENRAGEEGFVDTTNRSPVPMATEQALAELRQLLESGTPLTPSQQALLTGLIQTRYAAAARDGQAPASQQQQQQQQQPHFQQPSLSLQQAISLQELLALQQQQQVLHVRAYQGQAQGSSPNSQSPATASREAAERIMQGIDGGEARLAPGSAALGSPGAGGGRLGQFYFEGDKK